MSKMSWWIQKIINEYQIICPISVCFFSLEITPNTSTQGHCISVAAKTMEKLGLTATYDVCQTTAEMKTWLPWVQTTRIVKCELHDRLCTLPVTDLHRVTSPCQGHSNYDLQAGDNDFRFKYFLIWVANCGNQFKKLIKKNKNKKQKPSITYWMFFCLRWPSAGRCASRWWSVKMLCNLEMLLTQSFCMTCTSLFACAQIHRWMVGR